MSGVSDETSKIFRARLQRTEDECRRAAEMTLIDRVSRYVAVTAQRLERADEGDGWVVRWDTTTHTSEQEALDAARGMGTVHGPIDPDVAMLFLGA